MLGTIFVNGDAGTLYESEELEQCLNCEKAKNDEIKEQAANFTSAICCEERNADDLNGLKHSDPYYWMCNSSTLSPANEMEAREAFPMNSPEENNNTPALLLDRCKEVIDGVACKFQSAEEAKNNNNSVLELSFESTFNKTSKAPVVEQVCLPFADNNVDCTIMIRIRACHAKV